MKKVLFFAGLFLAAGVLAQAYPWAITVNHYDMSISIIDLGANPPKVYGPFLKGQLGTVKTWFWSTNWWTDECIADAGVGVAVTPDGRYALILNYGGGGFYKVDLADPTHPVLAGIINLRPYWPSEVNITRDGKIAVLPDSKSATLIFIDIASFQSFSIYALHVAGKGSAGPVACGPGGLVIAAPWNDYESWKKGVPNILVYGNIDAAGTGLAFEKVMYLTYGVSQLAISPDGSTLISNIGTDRDSNQLETYKIDQGGNLSFFETIDFSGLSGGYRLSAALSIVFSADGRKAFYMAHRNTNDNDLLYGLVLNDAGQADYEETIDLLSEHWDAPITGGGILSVSPDGRYAVTGWALPYYDSAPYPNDKYKRLQLVSLEDFSVSWIPLGAKYPWAVECFNTAVLPPVDASIRRTSNSYIFYKETINRLAWQPDTRNYSPIAMYRIYRKLKSDDDSAYQLLAEVLPIVTSYADRRLAKNTDYSYRITAVNAEGRESAPVEVGN